MTTEQSDDRSYREGFLGAVIGSGIGYSLVNGYGLLHAVGMAVAFLIIGLVLLGLYEGSSYLAGELHAG